MRICQADFGVPPAQIGNHLGALSQWQSLVRQASLQPPSSRDELFFSVVGLHALTVPQDPKVLLRERREMFACLLALGLDDAGACVFHQDMVREHAELGWYLNTVTPVNRLMRMTSWKVSPVAPSPSTLSPSQCTAGPRLASAGIETRLNSGR